MNLNYCLINRTIIELSGNDSVSFLQGLITKDIKLLSNNNSLYTLLLTNNGRFFLDFFIIKNNNNLLIDINTNYVEVFNKIIQYYKLRSHITLKVKQNLKVYTIFNNQIFPDNNTIFQENTININNNIIIIDPRLYNLGLRIITYKPDFLNNAVIKKYIGNFFNTPNSTNIIETDCKNYLTLRYKYTVPEVTELIQEKSIPLECNFEWLNALSFNKGCYLGQEFTNASKRIMVTRKKLITMEIKNYYHSNYDFLKYKNITNKNGEKVGKILSTHNRYIMALVKLVSLKEAETSFFSNDIELETSVPNWLIKKIS